jgi:hypothetical protein
MPCRLPDTPRDERSTPRLRRQEARRAKVLGNEWAAVVAADFPRACGDFAAANRQNSLGQAGLHAGRSLAGGQSTTLGKKIRPSGESFTGSALRGHAYQLRRGVPGRVTPPPYNLAE